MYISLLLIIVAGISQGIATSIRKYVSTRKNRATTITTTIMLLDSIFAFPLVLYEFRVAQQPITWILMALSVAAFALSATFQFKSYQRMDLSLSTILQRTNIIFIAVIGSFVLHERLTVFETIGVLFLFSSGISVLYEHKRIRITSGAWYALLAAIFGSVAAVLDKQILNDFSPFTYAFINSLLVGSVFLWRDGTIGESIQFFYRYPVQLIASSILGVIALALVFVVLSESMVSRTMPIYKTVSFFIPVFLGVTLYKERGKFSQKIAGVMLALSGIALMYV